VTIGIETAQWVLRGILALVFVGMGVSHFVPGPGRAMAAMIPASFVRRGMPGRKALVRFTGACEVAGGVGLLVPATQFAAGMALVVFLIAVFPANSYAAANRERFGAFAIPFWRRYLGQVALVTLCVLAALPL